MGLLLWWKDFHNLQKCVAWCQYDNEECIPLASWISGNKQLLLSDAMRVSGERARSEGSAGGSSEASRRINGEEHHWSELAACSQPDGICAHREWSQTCGQQRVAETLLSWRASVLSEAVIVKLEPFVTKLDGAIAEPEHMGCFVPALTARFDPETCVLVSRPPLEQSALNLPNVTKQREW